MNIIVGYITRERTGYDAFMEAYASVDAGIDHRLLFIRKGSLGQSIDVPCQNVLDISDYGLALCAHGKAIHQWCNIASIYCGLNSWSRPLKDGWLLKLVNASRDINTGLVSCTGSYESFANVKHQTFIHKLYRQLLWSPYPNPHLRLTGFCGRVSTLRKYWPSVYLNKALEEWHEHGRMSVSRRMRQDNLKISVVSSAGVYAYANWESSNTYRTGKQEHLLVADKQTDKYLGSTFLEKKTWSHMDHDKIVIPYYSDNHFALKR